MPKKKESFPWILQEHDAPLIPYYIETPIIIPPGENNTHL